MNKVERVRRDVIFAWDVKAEFQNLIKEGRSGLVPVEGMILVSNTIYMIRRFRNSMRRDN